MKNISLFNVCEARMLQSDCADYTFVACIQQNQGLDYCTFQIGKYKDADQSAPLLLACNNVWFSCIEAHI